jgi:MFS family permease
MNPIDIRKRYLYYRALTNLWFLGAVWIYFYRVYIDDTQIGLLDSLAFFVGLIFEIPSGAIADRIGRKKMVNL